jgi:excisionase family DNA binding protein
MRLVLHNCTALCKTVHMAQMLRSREVAERLGISLPTVSRWANRGRLPFQRDYRGDLLFRASDVRVERALAALNGKKPRSTP